MIHPWQIQAVQEEFSPSPERVQWAKELIAAFDEHQKEGKVTSIPTISKVLMSAKCVQFSLIFGSELDKFVKANTCC